MTKTKEQTAEEWCKTQTVGDHATWFPGGHESKELHAIPLSVEAFLAGWQAREAEAGWIAVSERLPERDKDTEQAFFTYDERSGTFDTAFYDCGWELDPKEFVFCVTHWKEAIPPPPKEAD